MRLDRDRGEAPTVPFGGGSWGQSLEQLEGSEAKHFAAVHIGLGKPVDQASLRQAEGRDAGGGGSGQSLRCRRATQTFRANPALPASRIADPRLKASQASGSSAITRSATRDGASVPGWSG